MLSSWSMNVPGFAKRGVYRVTSLLYVQMIPSPRVGSGVEVRQTWLRCQCHGAYIAQRNAGLLSTFWNVKMPSRSNCVPFEVTVKFSVTAAQDPTGPQSVGGLEMESLQEFETRSSSWYVRVLNNLGTIRRSVSLRSSNPYIRKHSQPKRKGKITSISKHVRWRLQIM